jgi:predicted transporter
MLPVTWATMTTEARGLRRKRLERAWIVVGLGYSILRVFVANATVKKYGVNIWAFAVVEIGSSFPYSLGTARVVARLVDKSYRSATKWGMLAGICFIAPETFIIITGERCSRRHPGRCHRMPKRVYEVIGLVILILGALAVWSVIRKVRQARSLETQAPATSAER